MTSKYIYLFYIIAYLKSFCLLFKFSLSYRIILATMKTIPEIFTFTENWFVCLLYSLRNCKVHYNQSVDENYIILLRHRYACAVCTFMIESHTGSFSLLRLLRCCLLRTTYIFMLLVNQLRINNLT